MVMYGIYNVETIENAVNTLEKLHNKTKWNKRLFAGKHTHWFNWYLSEEGAVHYAINSILYINTLKEKYKKMYEKLIYRTEMYAIAINSFKGLFTNYSFVPNKFKRKFR